MTWAVPPIEVREVAEQPGDYEYEVWIDTIPVHRGTDEVEAHKLKAALFDIMLEVRDAAEARAVNQVMHAISAVQFCVNPKPRTRRKKP